MIVGWKERREERCKVSLSLVLAKGHMAQLRYQSGYQEPEPRFKIKLAQEPALLSSHSIKNMESD